MRTPQIKQPAAAAGHQKKQLMMLGGLSIVLVAVVALQFGQDAAPVAQALTESESSPAAPASAPVSSSAAAAAHPLELSSNLALSEPDATVNDLNPGAFDSFWSLSEPAETSVEEAPPPSIRLSATLIGREGALDVAVIDGTVHYVGDNIQGWSLNSITSREVSLRSPSNRVVSVAMPLFRPTPPPVANPVAASLNNSVAAAPSELARDS
ncbi:MAG: hypothetical protein ACI9EF_001129 [Pseudohongiellaceae bacterium]